MNGEEFLEKLLEELNGNAEISNIGFEKPDTTFFDAMDSKAGEKLICCMSLSSFYENLDKIASLKNINSLDAIISLPVFRDDDNLIILIFDFEKDDSRFLFIDESDSLLHKTGEADWTFASKELVSKITGTYGKYGESDTSLIMDIEDIISSASSVDETSPNDKPLNDEILALKDDMVENPSRKSRVIHRQVSEEILALKNNFGEIQPKKSRVIHDEVADGLLELKMQKSSENHADTGFAFLNDAMYYKKRQNPENLLTRDGEPLIDGEVEFRKLRKIADIHNIYFKNDENSILIATCKGCNSKIVHYNTEITDFGGEVFIELINISDIVLIDYLYEYLNSTNGLNDLLYYSKGHSHITPADIRNIKIPIPPLDVQKEIVDVARESREFFKSIELLKKEFNSNILDYKRMKNSLDGFKGDIKFDSSNEVTQLSRSLRHAYNGLIWPLAISYLSATKGGFESVEKKDNYLVLFEFVAAFNTVILLSGLPRDVYKRNYSRIWNSNNPNEYKQMTFANWVYLSKNLAMVYRSNNFESKLDEELFDKITSDKLLNILEKAKNFRNEESHGSQSNAYEAEQVIEKLDVFLEDIFDILEVYSDYKLIYITGDMKSTRQAYNHRVILLNGPCAQPIYDDITFGTVLQQGSLYLYNPKNNKKLLLKDNLIKFSPTDENKKHWALFIYYSCDRKEFNAFYKCFQSNEKDVKADISSLERDILDKNF